MIPNHSILKKQLLTNKDDVCNDIMALTPFSYISQENISPDNDEGDDTIHTVQNESDIEMNNNTAPDAAATDVRIVDSSVDTASGCSKCGEVGNPTRVAELELKVATLEQEVARYKGDDTQHVVQNGNDGEISNSTIPEKSLINEFLCYITYSCRANNDAYLINILKSKYEIKQIKA